MHICLEQCKAKTIERHTYQLHIDSQLNTHVGYNNVTLQHLHHNVNQQQQRQQSDDHRSTAAASRCSDRSFVAPPSLHPPSLSDCYADGSFTDDSYSREADSAATAARVQPPLQREAALTVGQTVGQKPLVLLGTAMTTSGEY
jgi:hypothetical protein